MNPHPAAPRRADPPEPDDPELGERVPELGWPVGVVSERLGIAAPTLRSWDRRHGVGPSLRTAGNHRRYTELDMRRVQLMARLTAQGVPAQSAADSVLGMDARAIADRLDAVGRAAGDRVPDGLRDVHDVHDVLGDGEAPVGLGSAVPDDAVDLVEAIVAAARALDARTMSLLYRQVMRRRDVGRAWVEVFAPALRRVG